MSEGQVIEIPNYTTGVPRRHHSLYLEDGNFVMQVGFSRSMFYKRGRALTPVRYSRWRMRYSTSTDRLSRNTQASLETCSISPKQMVLGEGLATSPSYSRETALVAGKRCWNGSMKGTHEIHSIISSTVSNFQNASHRFNLRYMLSGERLLLILPIAHKYCMKTIEENILEELENASNTAEYVALFVAARIVGSDRLYEKALASLMSSNPPPDLEQARRIGLDAFHAIMIHKSPQVTSRRRM